MKANSHSLLEPAMKCIADYAVSQNPAVLNCNHFIANIDGLSDSQIDTLAHLMDANRVTVQLYQTLENLESPGICKLRSRLKPSFDSQVERKRQRDALLRKLITVFEDACVDYVVFKTLNSSGWIGVDIDVMIGLSDYQSCVDALLKSGFYSIDDLSKRYATGFMFKRNPIIVDLHTELAVLGVRYMSSELLLKNSKRMCIGLESAGDLEPITLSAPNETVAALVRIAHSVLKEGMVTISEVAEVFHVSVSDSIIDYVDEEGLQLSASIFAYTSWHVQGTERFTRLIMFNESFLHSLTKDILVNSITDSIPPFKIPTAACVLAFMDHLKNRGELGKYAPTLLYSFKFRRNAAHLGHKLLERFVAS